MTLPPRLFCDTSFFYACLDSADANHPRASRLIEDAVASRSDFLTTWDIVSETATLLRYRYSFTAAWTFLSEVKPTLRLVLYSDGVRTEAEEIFRIYGQDHQLSFCDAISFYRGHDRARQFAVSRIRSRLSRARAHCARLIHHLRISEALPRS